MKKIEWNIKFLSVGLIVLIIFSSLFIFESAILTKVDETSESYETGFEVSERAYKITSVFSEEGTWITATDSPEGTPAEATVATSDTTGITIGAVLLSSTALQRG